MMKKLKVHTDDAPELDHLGNYFIPPVFFSFGNFCYDRDIGHRVKGESIYYSFPKVS